MLTILTHRTYYNLSKILFKLDKFGSRDYQTIAKLIKIKLPIYNEQIKMQSNVRVIDENGKLIGVYSPTQARKKAQNRNKDLILLKNDPKATICKLIEFRQSTLNTFYNSIVLERNQQVLNKAQKFKNFRLKLSFNENQLKIKGKQISQVAKNFSKVRVYIRCKEQQADEAISKLELFKSQIMNKCKIVQDMNEFNDQEQQQNQSNYKNYSIVIKSTQNQFIKNIKQAANQSPEQAILQFLAKYYKQQDIEMKDIKGQMQQENIEDISIFEENINEGQLQIKKKKKNRQKKRLRN